jgi:glycosyltransferase involved in cell wall biosynthesis
MATKRIVHLSTWKSACGIATYCENFVNAIEARGIECDVIPITPSDWREYLPSDTKAWHAHVTEATEGADLVHIQHEHGLFGHAVSDGFALKQYGAVLKSLHERGIPSVTTFHTQPIALKLKNPLQNLIHGLKRKYRWKKYVAQYFESGLAQAIVHSMQTRKLFARMGVPAKSIHVLRHPCLPPREIKIDSQTAKQTLGYPEDAKIVALFGFIGQYKGHDIVLETLQNLPENYHFAIVGGMHPEACDGYLDHLVRTIQKEEIERVRITGWVDRQTADLYFAATDVCVAPYRGDTVLSGSGAITWALSSGRPVIASKIEAFRNVNRIADCMMMITPDKTAELGWAIEKLVEDESLRTRLVDNATKFCREHSWDSTLDEVFEVYASLGVDVAKYAQASQTLRVA